eukprot:SAG11_NODE_3246_length_2583_cov_3.256844_2_plen_113_part_00
MNQSGQRAAFAPEYQCAGAPPRLHCRSDPAATLVVGGKTVCYQPRGAKRAQRCSDTVAPLFADFAFITIADLHQKLSPRARFLARRRTTSIWKHGWRFFVCLHVEVRCSRRE